MSSNLLVTVIQFVLVLGVLIFAHEFGHYIMARIFKIEVEEFGFGFPPKIAKLFTFQGTDFTLNAIPFGAFVRPKGENDPEVSGGLASANPWKRLGVLFGGPIMNLLVGLILFTVLFIRLGVPEQNIVQIEQVSKGSPSEQAGILAGDRIVSAAGTKIDGMTTLQTIIQDNRGKEITMVVDRNGQEVTLQITPRENPPQGEGPLGIVMSNPTRQISVIESIPLAAQSVVELSKQTILTPIRLIRGDIKGDAARVVGPVGIFSIYRIANERDQEAQSSATPQPAAAVLTFVAYISVALGITNLLPIPALDGGRIIFILPELILRKRVPAKYENYVHMFGFIALLLLMAIITMQDIFNPIQLPK